MEKEPSVILLVEDNPDHAELIVRSLQGHRVANRIYHVPDGEAALAYLFRRGEFADPRKSPRPQLILLDLRLPRVDGLQVLKEIKATEELRHIPVVIITTSEAEGDVGRAYNDHANSYLVKPADFENFTQLMDDLGFYWLGWNRPPRSWVTDE
jgi:CheY-like chemotaxis protein